MKVRKWGWKKSFLTTVILSLMFVPFLTACNFGGSDIDDNTTRVLRIATMYGDERNEHIRSEFTDLFEFANKNIEIEIVAAINYNDQIYGRPGDENEQPDPLEVMKEMMEGSNPPDVIMLGLEEMSTFIDNNLLQSLDAKIQDDGFDISGFAPAVLEGLKDLGNGTLYGLAPTFSSSALIYNMDLFEQNGVPYPHDNMSWDEVFELASRFAEAGTEDKPVFGFAFNDQMYSDIFYNIQTYAAPLGLQVFDENVEKMMVNSPQWAEVWGKIVELQENKIIPGDEDWQKIQQNRDHSIHNPYQWNTFISGHVAMTLVHHNSLDQIISANRNADQYDDMEQINWDIVTVPFHEEYPNVGGNMHMHPVMAINANAQNPNDAWDFIKFVNGEEWAQLKSKSSYSLVSRVQYNEPKNGLDYNMDAFFQTKPAVEAMMMNSQIYMKYPNIWQVESIGQNKLREVIQGNKTVEEALQEWENEGNQMLEQIKENPGGGGGGIDVMPMPTEEVIID